MTISQRLIRFWRKKSNSKHIYDLEERTFKFAKRSKGEFINHRKIKITVLVIEILVIEIYLSFGTCYLVLVV